jgi:hypothetical protein
MHYVPEWIKTNPAKYPRELNAYGKLLDVMSPHSTATLEAERRAFATLMHYLREIDGREHIVIMMQVENEPGSVGSVRDFSAAANKEFTGSVPQLLHVESGTWSQIYGADADERFAAYATAHTSIRSQRLAKLSMRYRCAAMSGLAIPCMRSRIATTQPQPGVPEWGRSRKILTSGRLLLRRLICWVRISTQTIATCSSGSSHVMPGRTMHSSFWKRTRAATSARTCSTRLVMEPSDFRRSGWTIRIGALPTERFPLFSRRTSPCSAHSRATCEAEPRRQGADDSRAQGSAVGAHPLCRSRRRGFLWVLTA